MGWIVSVILAVLVSVVFYLVGWGMQRYGQTKNEVSTGRLLRLFGLALLVFWVGLHTASASIHQVAAGHVGVLYTFQNITGQTGEGLQFIAPWQGIRVESVRVQRYSTEDLPRELIYSTEKAAATKEGETVTAVPKGHIGAFSKDTQDVFVKATLNLRVSSEAIQWLYRNVGPDWKAIIVAPRFTNFLKEQTVAYETVEIAPNREKIRTAVRDRLKAEMSEFSIDVNDLLIDNIDFRPEFKSAIENKQMAKQKALEETANVEKQRQLGLQEKARADGQAMAIRAIADANAYANDVLAASLKGAPEVIAYNLVAKLGDKIQVALLPAGQGFLIDLKSLGLGLTNPEPGKP